MQYPKSNLIKDIDGTIYKLDKLYLGIKEEVLPEELSKYDMSPMSGVINLGDGLYTSEVDLILSRSSSGGSGLPVNNFYTKHDIDKKIKEINKKISEKISYREM